MQPAFLPSQVLENDQWTFCFVCSPSSTAAQTPNSAKASSWWQEVVVVGGGTLIWWLAPISPRWAYCACTAYSKSLFLFIYWNSCHYHGNVGKVEWWDSTLYQPASTEFSPHIWPKCEFFHRRGQKKTLLIRSLPIRFRPCLFQNRYRSDLQWQRKRAFRPYQYFGKNSDTF